MIKKNSRDYELAETERRLERGQIITLLIGFVAGAVVTVLVFLGAF